MLMLKKFGDTKFQITIMICIFFLYIAYALFVQWYPFKMFEFVEPIFVSKKEVRHGEYIRYKMHYIKYRPIRGTELIQVIDGAPTTLQEGGSNRPVGENNEWECVKILRRAEIAKHQKLIWTGQWVLHFPFTNDRIITVVQESNEFDIVE